MMKQFLTESTNTERAGAVWNMAASILNSFQSVICLIVLSRTVGTAESGLFTIAFAYSNMFLTIGKYGMRHYQVSDSRKEYSFEEYRLSRVVTCIFMLLAAFLYFLLCSADEAKSAGAFSRRTGIMIWMCILRLPDAAEDVYYGMYQQNGRLDVAAKTMTVRMIIQILSYCVCIAVTQDQYISLIITSVINLVVLIRLLYLTESLFVTVGTRPPAFSFSGKVKKEGADKTWGKAGHISWKNTGKLLASCFPLFLGSFLTIYIANAPKYAIDAVLTDEEQAYYGYISMPVSVVGLLAGFVFIPLIYRYTMIWNSGKRKIFFLQFIKMAAVIACITVGCVILAYVAGIPVLSLFFHTDLAAFRTDLLILLVGGGFSALAAFLGAVITVMRLQNWLLIGYVGTALVALLLSERVVQLSGVYGASLLYLALMAFQSLSFGLVYAAGMIRRVNHQQTE